MVVFVVNEKIQVYVGLKEWIYLIFYFQFLEVFKENRIVIEY